MKASNAQRVRDTWMLRTADELQKRQPELTREQALLLVFDKWAKGGHTETFIECADRLRRENPKLSREDSLVLADKQHRRAAVERLRANTRPSRSA